MVKRTKICKVCGCKTKIKGDIFCLNCWKENMPFSQFTKQDLDKEKGNFGIFSEEAKQNCVSNKDLMDQLNKLDTDDEIDNQAKIKCKYISIEDINNLELKNKRSILHLNISSLPYHIDELKTNLIQCKKPFDIIGITETRIKKGKTPYTDISLNGYNYESTPTESSAGGVLLYLSSDINYKCRNDLNIYKSKELESIFVETLFSNSENYIIGCIYKHPNMPISEYNESYLSPLLDKLSKEKKEIIILGDFNIDLLNYEKNHDIQENLNLLYSNSYLPYITLPTRLSNTTKTLIDNIFYKGNKQPISGNLTIDISDHLAQVLFLESKNVSSFNRSNSEKKYRDFQNLDNEKFILDMFEIDWETELKLTNNDVNFSFDRFLDILNCTLDKHAPYKTLSKSRLKTFAKPWITQGILKSIKIKNLLYKKLCKCKSPENKAKINQKFKQYRNLIKTLTRRSKNNYFYQYFNSHKKNLRKTWQGIKNIINLNSANSTLPSCINKGDSKLTDPIETADEFNDFFSNIGKKLESKIVKANTTFDKFLKNPNEKSIFF